jgi:SAM-dependent methyltransferase
VDSVEDRRQARLDLCGPEFGHRTSHPPVQLQRRSLLDVTAERDGQFDTVLTVNTVHALQAHDVVLPHLRSLVAPGGHLVLVDLIDLGVWGTLDWQIASAFADAEQSYRHRSRDLNVALDLLRLRLHPTWLTHSTTNVPLTREQFHTAYSAAFPGAGFIGLNAVVTAVHWHNAGPAQPSAGAGQPDAGWASDGGAADPVRMPGDVGDAHPPQVEPTGHHRPVSAEAHPIRDRRTSTIK